MLKHELFERLVVTIHAITMPALLFSIPLLEAGGRHLFGTLSPLSKTPSFTRDEHDLAYAGEDLFANARLAPSHRDLRGRP